MNELRILQAEELLLVGLLAKESWLGQERSLLYAVQTGTGGLSPLPIRLHDLVYN
jgi:hypothetical protein